MTEPVLYSARGSPLECYICAGSQEDEKLLSVCLCKGRYIHLSCQQALVERMPTHSVGCPVCKARYTNAEIIRSRRKLTHEGQRVAAVACAIVLLFGLGAHQIHSVSQPIDPIYKSISLSAGTLFVIVALIALLLLILGPVFCWRQGELWKLEHSVKLHTRPLPRLAPPMLAAQPAKVTRAGLRAGSTEEVRI